MVKDRVRGGAWKDFISTEVSLHLEWSKDIRRASLQEIHSIPSSREPTERSHHGCPTHAGISRLFAHGESRGGHIVFPELSPFCLCFFSRTPLLLNSPCHSPHTATAHTQRGRSGAFISLKKGDVAPLLLPFTTSRKIPRTTFQPGSEAEPGSNGALKLLQWVEKLLTGGFKARGLIHETRAAELVTTCLCSLQWQTFDQLHLPVKQRLWLHV